MFFYTILYYTSLELQSVSVGILELRRTSEGDYYQN